MNLLPGRKPADTAYASADDWLTAVDLSEADVAIPLGRGVTLWVHYRGLTLAEEQAAFRAARTALIRAHQEQTLPLPEPDECDDLTLMIETLRYGVTAPHLTSAQAYGLREKNPHVIEQLYRLIRQVSRLTPGELDGIVDELVRQRTGGAGLAAGAGAGVGDAPGVGAPDR